ncbi:MAG: hypothetical protein HWD63_16125 [Candidatus Parvibacillus calidus]|nr:MAG: hypothetical protein HWD63_16125 [Candidatus Parvibacillus calidus]
MRTLHNTIINPTYWNKVRSVHCGTAVLSIPEDKCYLPTLTEKVSHPTCKKDKNPPKRNTVHHPVSLNTEYSKAGLA